MLLTAEQEDDLRTSHEGARLCWEAHRRDVPGGGQKPPLVRIDHEADGVRTSRWYPLHDAIWQLGPDERVHAMLADVRQRVDGHCDGEVAEQPVANGQEVTDVETIGPRPIT